ncbi:MAG: hypothetical protein HZR80_09520 [Candidatus Heimdallarchaeota archaeon]
MVYAVILSVNYAFNLAELSELLVFTILIWVLLAIILTALILLSIGVSKFSSFFKFKSVTGRNIVQQLIFAYIFFLVIAYILMIVIGTIRPSTGYMNYISLAVSILLSLILTAIFLIIGFTLNKMKVYKGMNSRLAIAPFVFGLIVLINIVVKIIDQFNPNNFWSIFNDIVNLAYAAVLLAMCIEMLLMLNNIEPKKVIQSLTY